MLTASAIALTENSPHPAREGANYGVRAPNSPNFHLRATNGLASTASVEAMKPENPIAITDTAVARVLPADSPRSNKKLKLSLEAGHFGSAIVLHCQGRIIFNTEARALSTLVLDVLPSARRMVVDLAGVDSVDSSGLGELVLTLMWAEAAGYSLKFASPKKSVRHLFEITNLVSVFDVYASVPEAMAAMVQEEVQSA